MKSFGWALGLLSLIWISIGAPALHAQAPGETFSSAVDAYRDGDYATAETLWKSALQDGLDRRGRGRVLYNLGNAAYRRGELMEAIARYTSCIRVTPRDKAAWNNLEFTRREVQLEPADRGDLKSTVSRILSSVDRSEAGWLVLLCLGLWGIALAMEAFRGGTLWRRLALLGVPLVLCSAAPLMWELKTRSVNPLMVVEFPAAALRTEPGDHHTAVAQAGAGVIVEGIDQLGDWVRIETESGERGWTPRTSVFKLQ